MIRTYIRVLVDKVGSTAKLYTWTARAYMYGQPSALKTQLVSNVNVTGKTIQMEPIHTHSTTQQTHNSLHTHTHRHT